MNQMTEIDLFAKDSLFRTEGYILPENFHGETFVFRLYGKEDYSGLLPKLTELGLDWETEHDDITFSNPYDYFIHRLSLKPELLANHGCFLMLTKRYGLSVWLEKEEMVLNSDGIPYRILTAELFHSLYQQEYNRINNLLHRKVFSLKNPKLT